jgi:hypothetical protein
MSSPRNKELERLRRLTRATRAQQYSRQIQVAVKKLEDKNKTPVNERIDVLEEAIVQTIKYRGKGGVTSLMSEFRDRVARTDFSTALQWLWEQLPTIARRVTHKAKVTATKLMKAAGADTTDKALLLTSQPFQRKQKAAKRAAVSASSSSSSSSSSEAHESDSDSDLPLPRRR